ncbi:hypothetical protein [Enterococcus olivae]
MKTFKVKYIDTKGRAQVVYIYADTKEQAIKAAETIQGLALIGTIGED